MAEEANKEVSETTNTTTEMDIEGSESEKNGELKPKRSREEEEANDGVEKKQKVAEEEVSVEEKRLEKKSDPVSLGPKQFTSSVDMFDYFFKLLHFWPPNVNVNKYEQLVLVDLLKKGHAEADRKIGGGVQDVQVRFHPMWKSRCFFLIREDGSVDDFSFRKCVDHILPLPEQMKGNSAANKGLGGGKNRGGGGRGGGRGNKYRK